MSADGRYLPPRERSIEHLKQTYDRLKNTPVGRVEPEGRERSTKDPFGFEEAPADPLQAAKEVTERLVKFFSLACAEWGLDTEGMLFAAELAALNILNAKDCPLDEKAQARVRQAAFDYYTKSLDEVPEPTRPKR